MAQSTSRRHFLASSVSRAASFAIASCGVSVATRVATAANDAEPIIDIHQHTNYAGRSDEQLIAHQRKMGVTQTILLPSGSAVQRASTNDGRYNGLGGVSAGGNESVLLVARHHPREFFFGANEVTDLPGAVQEITRYMDLGAKIIGEQKFSIAWILKNRRSFTPSPGKPAFLFFCTCSMAPTTWDSSDSEDAREVSQDHLHRTCPDVLGQYRPEPC